jgi:acyl carrier protein
LPDTISVINRAEFKAALVDFINRKLPALHELKTEPNVDGSTLLFESGLIDSLGILHLIAFVERATGRTIPTRMVVMKHFQTVDAIAETFWPENL